MEKIHQGNSLTIQGTWTNLDSTPGSLTYGNLTGGGNYAVYGGLFTYTGADITNNVGNTLYLTPNGANTMTDTIGSDVLITMTAPTAPLTTSA